MHKPSAHHKPDVKKAEDTARHPTSAHVDQSYNVLILDDDTFEQQRLERICRTTGLPVQSRSVTTINGLATALDEECFDLVLIDYLLPDGDGLTAQNMVRSHTVNFGAAVVMMSNEMRTDVAITAMKRGSLDCLDKDCIDANILRDVMIASAKVFAEASHRWIGALLEDQRLQISQDIAKVVRSEMEFGRLIETIDTRVADLLAARGIVAQETLQAGHLTDPDPAFAFK